MRIGDRRLYQGESVTIVMTVAGRDIGLVRVEYADGQQKWVRLAELELLPEEAQR